MSSNVPRQNAKFNLEDYIPVSERIEQFYSKYPDGRIVTNVVELNHETGFVLIQAMVYRNASDSHPAATGHATEVRGDSYINKTSFVENCETGAVGRALALLGFEVKRGIASREDMQRTARMQSAGAGGAAGNPSGGAAAGAAAKPQAPPRVKDAGAPAVDYDGEILKTAEGLGYDAAKVRKWVNQKFKVAGGLESLSPQDKSEVLKIFRERAGG